MTVLAFIIGGTVAIGWLAALALLIYGLVTQHSFIEGIFVAFVLVSVAAGLAFGMASALLGYEWV